MKENYTPEQPEKETIENTNEIETNEEPTEEISKELAKRIDAEYLLLFFCFLYYLAYKYVFYFIYESNTEYRIPIWLLEVSIGLTLVLITFIINPILISRAKKQAKETNINGVEKSKKKPLRLRDYIAGILIIIILLYFITFAWLIIFN